MSDTGYTPPNEMPPSRIHKVLVGQKALVTGASKGLGQAIAMGYAEAGADVLVNYNGDRAGAEGAEGDHLQGGCFQGGRGDGDVCGGDEAVRPHGHRGAECGAPVERSGRR